MRPWINSPWWRITLAFSLCCPGGSLLCTVSMVILESDRHNEHLLPPQMCLSFHLCYLGDDRVPMNWMNWYGFFSSSYSLQPSPRRMMSGGYCVMTTDGLTDAFWPCLYVSVTFDLLFPQRFIVVFTMMERGQQFTPSCCYKYSLQLWISPPLKVVPNQCTRSSCLTVSSWFRNLKLYKLYVHHCGPE